MATRAKTTEEQLVVERMQNVVDGYKSQLAETTADMERYRKELGETRTNAREWHDRSKALDTEVDRLRKELHALTVDKARLEGYIDRAREFDPQPEPIMVPLEGQRSHKPVDIDEALRMYGSAKDRPQPWYKRR